MTAYQREFAQILTRYTQELETAILHRDISAYIYCKTNDQKNGTYDANYKKRLRIAMALLFYTGSCAGLEEFIRRLFMEELADRETNSFQGIGSTLEILSNLLLEYNVPEDRELFKRAQNANFDCYCGYEAGHPIYPRKVEDCGMVACLDFAMDLEEYEAAGRILELWKAEQTQWNKQNQRKLRFWQKQLGQHEAELETLCQLTITVDHQNTWEYCSALRDYLKKLVELGKKVESWHVITLLMDKMEESWFRVGLGRFVLEVAVEFILLDPPQEQAAIVWSWVWERLRKLETVQHNLYRKGAAAARKMKQDTIAADLDNRLAKERKQLGLD